MALRSPLFPAPFLPTAATTTTTAATAPLPSRSSALVPLFYKSQTLTLTLTSSSCNSASCSPLHHGPSLSRGRAPPPPPPPSPSPPALIDRFAFSRVFDLSALRVPAPLCSSLEHRLRGHLLNWPRIRNIARVPGDDVDPELDRLVTHHISPNNECMRSLLKVEDENECVKVGLSSVMYREKLAKEFNFRGYLKFRNLAKMSRPKTRRKKGEVEEREKEKERGERRGFAVVEVVEVDGDEEDIRGLLGEGFGTRRWRGPTRLLLLDERYGRKGVEELPEAVKAVLNGSSEQNGGSKLEFVKCQMTIFYDYWPLNEILEALLPNNVIIPTSFETVGHIAHLNLKEEHLPYKNLIAQVVLDKNRPKIQTVVNKVDTIKNEYRTMELEVLAGNHSLLTTVIENGFRFYVDLGKVYWNSRLATDRQRLVCCFSHDDVVCDVFAGVGPIAISAAKKVKHVYANDLNPTAVEYLERNIVLNKLDRKIEVSNMDGRRFISSLFTSYRPLAVTQVVMNLPNDAVDFLDAFRGIFDRRLHCGNTLLPKIHVYGFSKSADPEFDFRERIKLALAESMVNIEIHRVRLVAPGKWMLCGSFVLPEKVAFAKHAVWYH